MINRFKTIIWDWNGTILNDVNLCLGLSNKVLKREGLAELDLAGYRNVFGFPITAYYKRIGIDLAKISMDYLTMEFVEHYMSSVKSCQLHNEVESKIVEFNSNNLDQYILTAAHTDIALELLDYFNIRKHFKQVVGLDNHKAESKIEKGKTLIVTNEIDVAETVLIGDTIHDFEVSEALGVQCILIANGHQSKERLVNRVKNKARVLDDISELF